MATAGAFMAGLGALLIVLLFVLVLVVVLLVKTSTSTSTSAVRNYAPAQTVGGHSHGNLPRSVTGGALISEQEATAILDPSRLLSRIQEIVKSLPKYHTEFVMDETEMDLKQKDEAAKLYAVVWSFRGRIKTTNLQETDIEDGMNLNHIIDYVLYCALAAYFRYRTDLKFILGYKEFVDQGAYAKPLFEIVSVYLNNPVVTTLPKNWIASVDPTSGNSLYASRTSAAKPTIGTANPKKVDIPQASAAALKPLRPIQIQSLDSQTQPATTSAVATAVAVPVAARAVAVPAAATSVAVPKKITKEEAEDFIRTLYSTLVTGTGINKALAELLVSNDNAMVTMLTSITLDSTINDERDWLKAYSTYYVLSLGFNDPASEKYREQIGIPQLKIDPYTTFKTQSERKRQLAFNSRVESYDTLMTIKDGSASAISAATADSSKITPSAAASSLSSTTTTVPLPLPKTTFTPGGPSKTVKFADPDTAATAATAAAAKSATAAAATTAAATAATTAAATAATTVAATAATTVAVNPPKIRPPKTATEDGADDESAGRKYDPRINYNDFKRRQNKPPRAIDWYTSDASDTSAMRNSTLDCVIEAGSLMETEALLDKFDLQGRQGAIYALAVDSTEHAPLIRLRRAVAIALDAKLPAAVDDSRVPPVDRSAVDRERFGKGHLWRLQRGAAGVTHTLVSYVNSRLYRV